MTVLALCASVTRLSMGTTSLRGHGRSSWSAPVDAEDTSAQLSRGNV